MVEVSFIASSPLSARLQTHTTVARSSILRLRRCTLPPLRSSISPPTPKAAQTFNQPTPPSSKPSSNGKQQPPPPPDLEQKRRDVSRLLALFGRLALPYWRSEPSARRDLAGLVVLALLQSGVSVMFSYVQRDFWTALNTRDLDLFYHQVQLFFLALLGATPVVVFYQYLRDSCSLRWRNWITSRVVSQYCTSRNFYFLEADPSVDNPDQRISQDLNAFTTESIAFILTLLVSSVDLVCFSAVLFSIYPLLFGVLLLYAATGTVATAFLGKDLISLNYQQLVREADLRYSLVRMRENAESIAFFQGETREKSEVMRRLSSAVDNMGAVINLRRRLSFLQTGYRFSIQVLPSLVVAPRYFAGAIQLGSVTQSFSAFQHILNDLSLVINRFDSLSQFGAGIDRLAEFVQALERNVANEQRVFRPDDEKYIAGENDVHVDSVIKRKTSDTSSIVKVDNLTLVTPAADPSLRRTLVRGLSFKLDAGKRLLVSGPSGSGKSTMLRAIAGLWETGSGCITCPDLQRVFFVPQKPYCTLGTLRANLIYPSTVDDSTLANDDARLLDILRMVDLGQLPDRVGGLDALADWADMLSLGEQQRLQFGRLIHRHMMANCDATFIDEGTSALSVSTESRMYDIIRDMGISIVSVGHRPSLLQHHDVLMRPRKDSSGAWDVEEISDEQKKDRSVSQVL